MNVQLKAKSVKTNEQTNKAIQDKNWFTSRTTMHKPKIFLCERVVAIGKVCTRLDSYVPLHLGILVQGETSAR